MLRSAFILFCFISLSYQYKQTCKNTTDCPANAHCKEGSCYCNDKYVDDQQDILNCLKIAQNLTDPCEDQTQCTSGLGANAVCIFAIPDNTTTGYCGCKPKSHYVSGRCYESVLIGGNCTVDNQCVTRTRNINVACFEGQCRCPQGSHPSIDRGDCLTNSVLGGVCISSADCKTENSQCVGVCRCRSGFTPNFNKSQCLEAMDKLGDQCAEDTQCQALMENTVCLSNNICGCNQGSHQIKGSCLLSIPLGGNCLANDECVTKSMNFTRSGCLGGICKCRIGYKQLGDDCSAAAGMVGFDSQTFLVLLITSVAAFLLRS